jgi:hypothetical protein
LLRHRGLCNRKGPKMTFGAAGPLPPPGAARRRIEAPPSTIPRDPPPTPAGVRAKLADLTAVLPPTRALALGITGTWKYLDPLMFWEA